MSSDIFWFNVVDNFDEWTVTQLSKNMIFGRDILVLNAESSMLAIKDSIYNNLKIIKTKNVLRPFAARVYIRS